MQFIPQIAVQYVYLDFDGELTSYNGEILTIDNVAVKDFSLTEKMLHSRVKQGTNESVVKELPRFIVKKSDKSN